MAFAIFYDTADATPLANQVNLPPSGLSSADRALARAIWNGGLSAWQSAPLSIRAGADPREIAAAAGDADCRTIVITATINKAPVHIADLIGLLQRVAVLAGANLFMVNIANDLAATAIEPWP